jgi:hypothetical protein
VTAPENPYDWPSIHRAEAFAFADGVWRAELRNGFRHPVVDPIRFADAAVADGVRLPGFWGLYERMARDTAPGELPKAA